MQEPLAGVDGLVPHRPRAVGWGLPAEEVQVPPAEVAPHRFHPLKWGRFHRRRFHPLKWDRFHPRIHPLRWCGVHLGEWGRVHPLRLGRLVRSCITRHLHWRGEDVP